jgi:hypothetical protein
MSDLQYKYSNLLADDAPIQVSTQTKTYRLTNAQIVLSAVGVTMYEPTLKVGHGAPFTCGETFVPWHAVQEIFEVLQPQDTQDTQDAKAELLAELASDL